MVQLDMPGAQRGAVPNWRALAGNTPDAAGTNCLSTICYIRVRCDMPAYSQIERIQLLPFIVATVHSTQASTVAQTKPTAGESTSQGDEIKRAVAAITNSSPLRVHT